LNPTNTNTPADGDALDGAVTFNVDPADLRVAADLLHRCGGYRGHLVHAEQAVLQDLLGAEIVAPVDQAEVLREPGEEEALLERRIAAADDREVLTLEERAVADRAVRDAASVEFGLAGDLELRRLTADCDDHRVRAVGRAVLHLDDLPVALAADLLHR